MKSQTFIRIAPILLLGVMNISQLFHIGRLRDINDQLLKALDDANGALYDSGDALWGAEQAMQQADKALESCHAAQEVPSKRPLLHSCGSVEDILSCSLGDVVEPNW